MAMKEKYDKFLESAKEKLVPYLKNAYITIRNAIKEFGIFLLRIISGIVGHIQSFWKGYLILICISFVVATFLFVYQTTKIAKQIVTVAESIKKIVELNDQSFQQSRQILLHVVLDMQVDAKMQPAEFNDLPIFNGAQFNQYAHKGKYNLYIKNESPFYYEGKTFFKIGLNYFDVSKNEWILRSLQYELSRRLNLAPNDLIKIELTNDLLNSGTLPKSLGKEETVKIDLNVHFEEAFQPKVKVTHRLYYF